MEDDVDLLPDLGQEAPVQEAPAPKFNTDISQGPTWASLPNPVYQPTAQEAIYRHLLDSIKDLPVHTIADADRAIQFGMQLEGRLGMDADLKAGVPAEKAMARWAPKLFGNNPVAMLKATQKPFEPTERTIGGQRLIQTSPNRFQMMPAAMATPGPVNAQPIMTPEGDVLGYAAPGARGGLHVMPNKNRGELTPSQQITLLKSQIEQLKQAAQDADEGSPEETQLKAQIKARRDQLNSFDKGVRLRHKGTNKVYKYPHPLAPGEVPPDYELLP